jgi:hypothetical protein
MEEALCDVQDALARHLDLRERQLEVALARLVAARLLSRDDPVELHAEATVRHGEQVVVAVGDHGELEALLEARERLGGVRERGPVAHRLPERSHLLGRGSEAVVPADAAQRLSQHLAIGQVLAGLELGLVPTVGLEQLLVRRLDAMYLQHGSQRREDPALPVDQRAVAVEAERVEGAEVERLHGRRV